MRKSFRALALLFGVSMTALLVANAGHLLAYASVVNAWWIRDFFAYQHFLAQTKPKPKIFVVSGSNGLFGFDGALIEKHTGRSPINFSTHVSFDLKLLAKRIEPYLAAGDIVLLPLEHAYYLREMVSDFEQRHFLTWMQSDFQILSRSAAFHHNFQTPIEMLLTLAWARITVGRKDLSLLSGAEIAAMLNDVHSGRTKPGRPIYSIDRADQWGFIYHTGHAEKQALSFVERNLGYPKLAVEAITPIGRSTIEYIEQLAAERKATVVYSWPAMISNRRHPRDDPKLLAMYRKFGEDMRAQGHNFLCDPHDFIFHKNYFWDTQYHLNAIGATLRTLSLLRCMADKDLARIDGPLPPAHPSTISDLVMVSRHRDQRQAELFDFELVLRNVQALADGLTEHKKLTGHYPATNGWQNPLSSSNTIAEWARTLAGAGFGPFPEKLFRSSRGLKLLYRSNGADYKIIVTNAKDCKYLIEMLPAAGDSRRSCVIALATDGAKAW